MPGQPTPQDLHVNRLLTNMSIGFQNPGYIGDQMSALVSVGKQSDIIPNFDQSPWFRDDAKVRAPGTKSEGGGWTVNTTPTYFANRYSRRVEIPDQLRRNADEPWDLDREATMFVTDKMMMRREVKLATDKFTTGVWGTNKTGATDFAQWDNYGASDPIVDIDEYRDDVEALVGMEPNCFTVGKQVHRKLKNHPMFIDRIKYTQRAQVTPDLIASLLEVEKYLVGKSIYTTAIEGTAEGSVTYTRIWGKNALLLYTPAAPSLMTPAAMYTFAWRETAAQGQALQWIKTMRDEEREVDIVEGNTNFDQKITSARSGLFMSAAIG
jgi:hypothetical protein